MAGKQTKFWKEHEPVLRKLAARGMTDRQIADSGLIPGKSVAAISTARNRYDIPAGEDARGEHHAIPELSRVVSETDDRTVYAAEESEDEPFDDLLERVIKKTDRAVRKTTSQRFALASIVTARPIAICFASDQHLNTSGATDVRRIFEDAELIQRTPGLYTLLGGDGVDNHIKHRAAMVSKASAPTDEYRLFNGYLRTLGHKVLAAISGNHDNWTKDNTGVDMIAVLAARNRVHFAPDEVVMTVRLVRDAQDTEGQEYTLKLRHKYRYNSSLNVGHTVKRMYDMGGDPFDVGVVCHNHAAHLETFDRHGETRWALRPGSYQIQTSHGRAQGYPESYPTCPGVVLWPNERRIEGFHDLRGLVEKLNDARRDTKRAA